MGQKSKREIVKWLHHFGYLEKKRPNEEELSDAVKDMQRMYGLKRDGDPGPVTSQAMGLFRCGIPDNALRFRVAGTTDCMWNKKKIYYYHSPNFRLPGISTRDAAKLIRTAANSWADRAGISIAESRTRSKADIYIDYGLGRKYGFDGPGNTLAWAELPCEPVDIQLRMMFDWEEPWSPDLSKRAGVFFLAVATHEFGHAFGLDHSEKSSDLMAPFYNPQIYLPQHGDIVRIQKLYGPPKEPRVRVEVRGVMELTEKRTAISLDHLG
jgi:matrix metalloproteinase-14 (membrane-inserted)